MTIELRSIGTEQPFYGVNLLPATDSIANNTNDLTGNYPSHPGFYGNGDIFTWEAHLTNASILYYYNNTNTLVWSFNISTFNSCNKILGVTLDRSNELVYISACNSSNLSSVYFGSIDSTGNVITISNPTLSTPLYSGTGINVGSSLTKTNNSNELNLRVEHNDRIYYEYVVNKTTGAFGTPTSLYKSEIIAACPTHKTPNGIYHGSIYANPYDYSTVLFDITNKQINRTFQTAKPYINISRTQTGSLSILIEWDEHYVVYPASTVITVTGNYLYDKTVYDAWIDTYAEKLGLI